MPKVLYEIVRDGKHIGWQALDELPVSKSYFFIPVRTELVKKIGQLDGHSYWENELARLLEDTIEHFFRTRPIEISVPKSRVDPLGLKLYDPRDKDRERLN